MGAMLAPMGITSERTPLTPTQAALRDALLSRNGVAKDDSPHRYQTLAFYEARAFKPVWSGGSDAEMRAGEVRSVLARVHEQGLRDADYAIARRANPAPGAETAANDIALTETLFAYARDVRTGRVRPGDVYEDALLPDADFDPAVELAGALAEDAEREGAFQAFLTALPPSHPEYRRLEAALARYRAIAESGGWPMLPEPGEIRLDGKDKRLPLLVERLALEDPKLKANPKPTRAALRDAVKRFQARNGLEEDARVGGETLAALNVTAEARAVQIAANMERWRWLPAHFERRFVAVNVPNQSVRYVEDGKTELTSRVIVGRKSSPTPLLRTAIDAVIVNPPWNIPGDIAARDLLPRLRKNPSYLATRGMVVTDGPPGDPYGRTIDWDKIAPAEFPYAIKQLPGPKTALGALMLDSPNDFDVYLHDTPNKNLFALDEREISNGCVRVQQIFPLASLALTGGTDEGMGMLSAAVKTRKTQRLALEKPLPVYFLYWTAMADADGGVQFRPDRYGRDEPLIAALDGEPTARGATHDMRAAPAMDMDEDVSP